jgi:hypothetical protein
MFEVLFKEVAACSDLSGLGQVVLIAKLTVKILP